MTSEQFEQAVENGYKRLLDYATQYLRIDDIYNPEDVLHNALLNFRVKQLAKFEWTSQEGFELIIKKRLTWDVKNFRAARQDALDFHEYESKEWPEGIEEDVGPLKKHALTAAFAFAVKALNQQEREVVLSVLAGFTYREISWIMDLSFQRVGQIWKQALQVARGYMKSVASDENMSV